MKMKIGVLGNCQSQGVAQCIRLLAPQVEVTARRITLADGNNPEVLEMIADEMAACDVAFIQDQPRLAALFEPALKRSGPRARRWPHIVFRGFHPDCVYVMRKGQPAEGVVGPYHSALICAAWAEGLSPRRAAGLFNSFSYAALGYFDDFEVAAALLDDHARRLGFDFSSFLTAPTTSFMHTINHPRVDILQAVALQALDLAGVPRAAAAALPDDDLALGPVWPVYPDLARRSGWSASPASWDPSDMEGVALRAYGALDRLGDRSLGEQDEPGDKVIMRAREFIQTHVIHARQD